VITWYKRSVTDDPRAVLNWPSPPPDFTVAYGDEPDQVADVRLPPVGVPTRPLVIFLHGGFWRAGYDRAHAGLLAADLAGRGYPVVCLEYRRIGQPGGGWPGTFDDVATGVAVIPELLARALVERGNRAQGAAFGPPILAGHSAGGQLALWAASRVPTRGVLALAPVADLARGYALGLGGGAVAALLGGDPAAVPDRYAAADPAVLEPPPTPTIVVHGAEDDRVPVALGRDYVAAARARGGNVRLVELAGVEHFAVIRPGSPAWPAVLTALADLA
jgi:acetyl esterase/lipase